MDAANYNFDILMYLSNARDHVVTYGEAVKLQGISWMELQL